MARFKNNLGGLLSFSLAAAGGAAACQGDRSDGDGSLGGGGGEIGVMTGGTVSAGGMPSGGSPGASTGGGPFAGIAGGGLIFTVESIEVSSQGVAVVEFRISDADGRPLDLEGKKTFGAVTPSFVLSWLGEDETGKSTQYTAYTTRLQESENGDSELQASTDADGSYETLEIGHYKYTFGTKIDITQQRAGLTHTLGVYATREVEGVRFVASAIESWVPDGSEVETILDVVTDAACNQCHTRLEAHGGARRGVAMCNLCHTESNSIDPDTGNTVDFEVMIHKIHMGEHLPSVIGGEPYQIIGYRNSVHDYSEVSYPWDMADCSKCHQGSQGDRWENSPAEKPCGSCHDRTYYGEGEPPEGWTKHSAGPRDDSECIVCHQADSLTPTAASHRTSLTDPNRPEVTAKLLGVTNQSPGSTPRIRFELSIDGEPVDILTNRPNRLRVRVWGPTTDVRESWSELIESSSDGVTAVACGDPIVPPCLEAEGTTFTYHATTPVPPTAGGSYFFGLDGRFSFEDYGNVAFLNPVLPVALDGMDVVARREIVSLEKCNSCHGDLGPHGGNYKEPLYCLNCHSPGATSAPEDLMPGQTGLATSINFKDLIHSVHASVGYPAPLNDCQQCHVDGSYGVPLAGGLLASTYATVACPSTASDCEGGMGGEGNLPTSTPFQRPPESAACVSCHNSTATAAHAETNAGMSGEACATCHGSGKDHDVLWVHALVP